MQCTQEVKPLSRNEQNLVLLEKRDFDTLYTQNYPLLVKLVKKYNQNDFVSDFEEAISMGNVAFTIAANKFDTKKEACFSTYLALCIQHVFCQHVRNMNAKKRSTKEIQILSLDFPIENGDKKAIVLADMLEDSTINVEKTIVSDMWTSDCLDYIAKQKNGDRLKKILLMRIEGITQRAIGETLGIKQTIISKALKRCAFYIEKYKQIEEKGECDEMGALNPKVIKVKTLLEEGVTDRKEIAKMLNITATSASTYLSLARKELAKEKQENLHSETPIDESNSPQQPEEMIPAKEPIGQEEPLIETPIVLTEIIEVCTKVPPAKRRLKPKTIASDLFTYTLEMGEISIRSNKCENSSLNVSASELDELLEDLKELVTYL